jgi:hypothetical protein
LFTVQNQPTLVFNVGGILFYTTSKEDYERFEDALGVFANTVGAVSIGAGAGALVNTFLPQAPAAATAGAEVIDISTKAAFATRASSAQSKVDTAASELLAVIGF